MFDMGNLKPDTREAIYRIMNEAPFVSEEGERGRSRLLSQNELRLLIQVLRMTTDTPANFPKGKWATVQHLESFL